MRVNRIKIHPSQLDIDGRLNSIEKTPERFHSLYYTQRKNPAKAFFDLFIMEEAVAGTSTVAPLEGIKSIDDGCRSHRCRLRSKNTQYRSSFDFDSIRFDCTSSDVMIWFECTSSDVIMIRYMEVKLHLQWRNRCDSIRFDVDSIRFWFNGDLIAFQLENGLLYHTMMWLLYRYYSWSRWYSTM